MVSLFFQTTFRLIVGFISLLVYMNLIGKMQLAPQSSIDQIGNYVLGGIIGGIIYNTDLPLWQFFMAIVIWGGLMLLVNYVKLRNLKAKRLMEGKPLLLMDGGVLQIHEFEKAQIGADDLVAHMHQQGVTSLKEVSTIWLESNGQLTFVKKNDKQLAWSVIEDGQFNEFDLRQSRHSKEWVQEKIQQQGYEEISKIFLAEIVNGHLLIYPYK